MPERIQRWLMCLSILALPMGAQASDSDLIVTRAAAGTPEQVVLAIEDYSKQKKWMYVGATKVKRGAVTLVKICMPEIGKLLWPVGLHVSAMLPCGNVGVYEADGKTMVSVLHPRYMQVLYPHPQVEKAAAAAAPLMLDMLEAVTR